MYKSILMNERVGLTHGFHEWRMKGTWITCWRWKKLIAKECASRISSKLTKMQRLTLSHMRWKLLDIQV